MKRTPLKRKTPLRAKVKKPVKMGLKRHKMPQDASKRVKARGFVIPEWYKKLPYKSSDHGSNHVQKRMWRVVSEYVRRRDFDKYGVCASCGVHFSDWRESQAGHWYPYSLCNSLYKFDPTFNIVAQCPACNTALYRSGAHVGHEMGEELKRRYGSSVLSTIKGDNARFRGMRLETWMCVDFVEKLRPDLVQ